MSLLGLSAWVSMPCTSSRFGLYTGWCWVGLIAWALLLCSPQAAYASGTAGGQGMLRASVSAGSAAGCRASYVCPPLGWCPVSVAAFEPHWDVEVLLGHSAPAALSLQPASSVCSAYLTSSVLGSALAPAGGDGHYKHSLEAVGLCLHCSAPTKFNLGSGGNTR